VRLRTLGLYLIGNREAILELAANRRALWVGLLFVLSAGFAREYDGEDLLREPWYLVIPVGASLVASFLLFLVACGSVFLRREGRPPFWRAYRSFLALFWLTAPLAWLYAIPYERFMSPGAATRANLWTLGLVAAWRVALMVRVVSVLTGRRIEHSLYLVMAFADAVALTGLYFTPAPVISFMGGVRLTGSESAVAGATMLVGCLGFFSAPIWLIGGLWAFAGRAAWQLPSPTPAATPISRGVCALVALSLLVWVPILPFTQPEQRLRARVERDLKSARVAEALDLMSAHELSDFPPGWEPPPHIGYREHSPHILDVLEALVSREVAPWVKAEFVAKFRRALGDVPFAYYARRHDPDLTRITRVLHGLPEGPDIAAEYVKAFLHGGPDERASAEYRANAEALLKLAEKGKRPKP
jgi:hypothetical protein